MIKLSIIIPYKNIADHLERLLQSITFEAESESVQVLVIDDKSTKQIERYEEIRNAYSGRVSFLSNTGIVSNAGAARNIGLKNATGKWLLFADADDYFVKGWFSIVKSYFESDSDIVFFNPTSWDDITNQIGDRHVWLSEMLSEYMKNQGEIKENRLRTGFVVPWSKMIRTDFVIRKQFFFDEVTFSNDIMFSVKCGLAARKFSVSPESIYCVVKRSGSLTGDRSARAYLQRLSICCDMYHYIEKRVRKEQFDLLSIRVLWYSSLFAIIKKRIEKMCSTRDVISVLTLLQENHISANPKTLIINIVRRKLLHQ